MRNNQVFVPPNWDLSETNVIGKNPIRIFLAGTIDNGDSTDWQQELINTINGVELRRPTSIYNPRRKEWPSSDNHREIDRQIEWELSHLEKADLIVMNILANSKSPISLMELGLFAREGRLMVFCPKTFYRYDNVRNVCKRYEVPLHTTNNIPYIAERVCKCIGIDEEAEKRKDMELDRKLILKHKEELEYLEANIPLDSIDSSTHNAMLRTFYNEKKEFEEKYGEPLCSEKE
jgi:hypothetical protein